MKKVFVVKIKKSDLRFTPRMKLKSTKKHKDKKKETSRSKCRGREAKESM